MNLQSGQENRAKEPDTNTLRQFSPFSSTELLNMRWGKAFLFKYLLPGLDCKSIPKALGLDPVSIPKAIQNRVNHGSLFDVGLRGSQTYRNHAKSTNSLFGVSEF